MSKRSKGVGLNVTPLYGVGIFEDEKARFKHQTLMQEFEELKRETDLMRSILEATKQKKLTTAAEVRFLRRRYKSLVKIKNTNSTQENNLMQPPNSIKRTKILKDQISIRKEATLGRLPPIPETKPKNKKQYIRKEIDNEILHGGKDATWPNLTRVSDSKNKRRIDIRKEPLARETTSILDLNKKERMHGSNNAALRNFAYFDLNQDSSFSGKEALLPSRAPIFDLNEISAEDEGFHSQSEAVKFDESNKSLIIGINDETQNDLKLSICRNPGEGSSRVGKRKISWQDPVALRV